MSFDQGKTGAAIVQRKKTTPTATAKVGANTVSFNKATTRWLACSWTRRLHSRSTMPCGEMTGFRTT